MNTSVFLVLLFSCFTSSYTSVDDARNWEKIFGSLLGDKFYLDSLTDNGRLQEDARIHRRDISDEETQQNDAGNVSPDDLPTKNNKDATNNSNTCNNPENWNVTWNNITTTSGISVINLKIISGNSDDCFGEIKVNLFSGNSNNGHMRMELILMEKNGTVDNKTVTMDMALHWRSEKCAMGCKNGSNHFFFGSIRYRTQDTNFSGTDASWMYGWNDYDNQTISANFQKNSFLAIKGGNVTERSSFSGIWTPTFETTSVTDYKIGQGNRVNISSWRKYDQFGPYGTMGGYGGWGNAGQHGMMPNSNSWGFGSSQNTFGRSQTHVSSGSIRGQGFSGTYGASQTQGTWANSGSYSNGGTYQTQGTWGNRGPHNNAGTYQAQGTWGNSEPLNNAGTYQAQGTWGNSEPLNNGSTYQTQGGWGNGKPHNNAGIYQAQGTRGNSEPYSYTGTSPTHEISKTSNTHSTDSNSGSHSTSENHTNGKSRIKTPRRG